MRSRSRRPSRISSPTTTSGICAPLRLAARRQAATSRLAQSLLSGSEKSVSGSFWRCCQPLATAAAGRAATGGSASAAPPLASSRPPRPPRGTSPPAAATPAAGRDAEGVAKEVFRPGVLVQPPNQVADGVDEVFLVAHRGVEQQIVGQLEQRPPLRVGHPFEHLELHAVLHAVFDRQHQGEGQVEEVVRGDAHAERRRRSPASSPRRPCGGSWRRSGACSCRRLRPAPLRGFAALRIHVRALDQPEVMGAPPADRRPRAHWQSRF